MFGHLKWRKKKNCYKGSLLKNTLGKIFKAPTWWTNGNFLHTLTDVLVLFCFSRFTTHRSFSSLARQDFTLKTRLACLEGETADCSQPGSLSASIFRRRLCKLGTNIKEVWLFKVANVLKGRVVVLLLIKGVHHNVVEVPESSQFPVIQAVSGENL